VSIQSLPIFSFANLSGEFFASGSADRSIKVWNYDYKLINTLRETDTVTSLLSFTDDKIISGSAGSIKIWKCAFKYGSIQCSHTITGHVGGFIGFIL
jgi:WD40 repeat protein